MMTPHMRRAAAALAVKRIWRDMTGRPGLSLDDIDADTKREMRETWISLAESAIEDQYDA